MLSFLFIIELAQECDYVREAGCGVDMKQLLSNYPEYYVPKVLVLTFFY